MDKQTAEGIQGSVNSLRSGKISLFEAYHAIEVPNDGMTVYALHVGNITYLVAQISEDVMRAKVVAW